MKKLMVLMFVSFLSLAGCGGGGGVETAAGIPGETPNVISDPVAGAMGNITVNFEPQQTQRALVTAGWTRNHARLVVRQFANVTIPGAPIYGPTECEEENGVEDCWNPIIGNAPPTSEYKETFKKISDATLDAAGAGSVSIAVPPGAGFSLEVLTYFSDKTGQPGVGATPTGLNYIVQYGKAHDVTEATTFTIIPGSGNTVYVTLDTILAQLGLSAEPVLATTTYPVSVAAKSEALRNNWKVRQTVDEASLTDQWFTATTADPGVSGTGTITLTAPASGTAAQLWHHGQFFISDHLLGSPGDASWDKWTFGTNNAGQLNPLGSINVVFGP